MIRRALEVPGLLALGAMATLVAALVAAIIATVLTFPFSILAILIFPIFLFGLVLAAVLAAPVTLAVLPLAYQLMRSRPILTQLALPLVGLAAGGAVAWFWTATGVLPGHPGSYQLFCAIGMISGLSGGAFFVRGLYA